MRTVTLPRVHTIQYVLRCGRQDCALPFWKRSVLALRARLCASRRLLAAVPETPKRIEIGCSVFGVMLASSVLYAEMAPYGAPPPAGCGKLVDGPKLSPPMKRQGSQGATGAASVAAAQASIGAGAVIGADALILEGVRIGHDVRIGDRFIAQPNAVIGGDGFSFVTPEPGAVEAVRRSLGDTGGATQSAYARIHSLGAVAIGDDVEVGANACIDRGTVADTVIGRGTKIDNLVQVGHNVRVGEDCLLCGQTGIAGSTRLGNRVVLGGQVGVTDHLTIGDDVIAGAGTLLRTNQAKGRVMLGNPAMPMAASVESYKALRRLPRLLARLGTERGTGATGDNNRLPNRDETD